MMMNKKTKQIVIASGYFDPLHVGHIEYLNKAKELGGILIVIVNNDKQTIFKKGKPFMNEDDRLTIINNLKAVDCAYISIDKDKSVCETIKAIKYLCGEDKVIFAKGGDRIISNIPEKTICDELGIDIVDGLGEKIRASSDFIKEKIFIQSPRRLCPLGRR